MAMDERYRRVCFDGSSSPECSTDSDHDDDDFYSACAEALIKEIDQSKTNDLSTILQGRVPTKIQCRSCEKEWTKLESAQSEEVCSNCKVRIHRFIEKEGFGESYREYFGNLQFFFAEMK